MWKELNMESETEVKLLKELVELKMYVKVLSANAVLSLLGNIATTPERQQIWRLADGSRSNEDIAKQINITLRAVQYFVQEAESIGLFILIKRGYPKRVQDITPKDWKPWKQSKDKQTTQSKIGDNSEVVDQP
jgi:hypothetical protein